MLNIDSMKEIWKDVLGYEGIYQVSNLGNVKSLKFNKQKILSKCLNPNGYYTVTLSKKGQTKNMLVHRLVCISFIENEDNKPQVNHIDYDKKNNNVDNLEWVTQEENNNHYLSYGFEKKFGFKYEELYPVSKPKF
jgi:hypothetical protein